MNNHHFEIPYIYNPGILSGKIPFGLFKKIKSAVSDKKAKEMPTMNRDLVASIRQEYVTPEIPGFRDYLHQMYAKWKDLYKTPDVPYVIDPIWTNYMKKGEFNPNHTHPDALAVFVLWVTIPYEIKDEISYNEYNNPTYPPKNSCFEFTYSMYDGKIVSAPIYVDKNMEGTITMFPSSMTHCVYPFHTCEEERVSIAGNIYPDKARMV